MFQVLEFLKAFTAASIIPALMGVVTVASIAVTQPLSVQGDLSDGIRLLNIDHEQEDEDKRDEHKEEKRKSANEDSDEDDEYHQHGDAKSSEKHAIDTSYSSSKNNSSQSSDGSLNCPVFRVVEPPEGCSYVTKQSELGCPIPTLECDDIEKELNDDTDKKKDETDVEKEKKKLVEELKKFEEQKLVDVINTPKHTSKNDSKPNTPKKPSVFLRFDEEEFKRYVEDITNDDIHLAAPHLPEERVPVSIDTGAQYTDDVTEKEAVHFLAPEPGKERPGCFTETGLWTNTPHLCAHDQQDIIEQIIEADIQVGDDLPEEIVKTVEKRKRKMEKEAEKLQLIEEQTKHLDEEARRIFVEQQKAEEERIVEKAMEKRFTNRTVEVQSKERAQIASAMKDARVRFQNVLKYRRLPQDYVAFVERNINWLQSAENQVRTQSVTDADLTLAKESLRQIVSNVKDILEKADELPEYKTETRIEISDVMKKTEKVLEKVQRAIEIMENEGRVFDTRISSLHALAQQKYNDAKAACASNKSRCHDLGEVIEILEDLATPMKEAFAADPTLQERVEALVQ